jgi:hypothetical protein
MRWPAAPTRTTRARSTPAGSTPWSTYADPSTPTIIIRLDEPAGVVVGLVRPSG